MINSSIRQGMAPCRGMAEAFVLAADLFLILGAAILC